MIFVYDDWNRGHVLKHGVSHADAEHVAENARPPYPKKIEDGKFIVYGPDSSGRLLEVVFVFKTVDQIEFDALDLYALEELADEGVRAGVYIIHAMPIAGRKKRQYRRRMR